MPKYFVRHFILNYALNYCKIQLSLLYNYCICYLCICLLYGTEEKHLEIIHTGREKRVVSTEHVQVQYTVQTTDYRLIHSSVHTNYTLHTIQSTTYHSTMNK
jgi:hypothetical protein